MWIILSSYGPADVEPRDIVDGYKNFKLEKRAEAAAKKLASKYPLQLFYVAKVFSTHAIDRTKIISMDVS